MATTVLADLPAGSRVAVIRLRSLGDCVLTTPALHLLKSARPDLQIGVVVESRFAGVYDGNPDVSATLGPHLPLMWHWRPRLVLNLHGGTRSMVLTAGSGAKWRAGFGHHRHAWVYNVRIPRAQQILGEERTVHTAEHVAAAMFHLGVARQEVPRARLFAAASNGARPYAVLHPFASRPDKTWPAERFLRVAEHLRHELGIEPVFLAGPGENSGPFASHHVLACPTLAQTKAVLQNAAYFIGNDSGPAHMAAAFQVPSVVLFGPSNVKIWGPWRTPAEALTAAGPITQISVDEVVQALARLQVPA